MGRLVIFFILIPALLFISLLLAFLIFPNIFKEKSKETANETFALSLSTPEDEEYTQTSLVKIIGKASPRAIIVAYSNDAGEVIKAKSDGIFSLDFPLAEGLNEISVIAQNETGEEKSEARDVFYDREGALLTSLTLEETNSPKESSPSSIQEVKERIKKERERQKIKVNAGSVKGILGQTATLTTKKGSRTVKVRDDSKIKIQNKEGKFSEIQVEDFAIALGKVDASGLLAQILIILPDQKPEISRRGLFGIVSETVQDGVIIVNQNKGEERKIIFDKNTKVLTNDQEVTIYDIKVGNRVAIVGKISEDKILAEKILLDPKNYSFVLEKFEKIATQSATSSATQSAL